MNIAERMRALIPILQAGINGIEFPDVKPESEDQWSENYAIVYDAWPDTDYCGHYFNEPQFRFDVQEYVRKHFDERAILLTSLDKLKSEPPHGTIVIRFYWQSQEIEVHRAGTKVGDDDD